MKALLLTDRLVMPKRGTLEHQNARHRRDDAPALAPPVELAHQQDRDTHQREAQREDRAGIALVKLGGQARLERGQFRYLAGVHQLVGRSLPRVGQTVG